MRTLYLLNIFIAFTLVACTQSTHKNTLKFNNNISQKSKEIMEGFEVATLGAGCFWCVEAAYQDLKGVLKVESGYAGGSVLNPSYKEVCEGTTGHAEVIQITFDPKIINYNLILELFWAVHDPTTLNRQGNDIGTQYRSAIFYHNDIQKEIAIKSKIEAELSGVFKDPIVTEVSPLSNYFSAEDYHQNYFKLNGDKNPYCSTVVAPKLAKFRKKYAHLLKE